MLLISLKCYKIVFLLYLMEVEEAKFILIHTKYTPLKNEIYTERIFEGNSL